MEFPEARLLVFAKAPVPGRVKTRLAGRLGKRGAAVLYRQLLDHTLAQAVAARLCPVELHCAPDARHGDLRACRRDHGVILRGQVRGDLGRRMDRALARCLERCPFAVLIGGDCVSLGTRDLAAALGALAAGYDAVLGPAEDSGYVLIGLRRPCPGLFQGIAWGEPGVLDATRRRLTRAGLRWLELPTGWDLDRPADLRRWRRGDQSESASSPKDSVV